MSQAGGVKADGAYRCGSACIGLLQRAGPEAGKAAVGARLRARQHHRRKDPGAGNRMRSPRDTGRICWAGRLASRREGMGEPAGEPRRENASVPDTTRSNARVWARDGGLGG